MLFSVRLSRQLEGQLQRSGKHLSHHLSGSLEIPWQTNCAGMGRRAFLEMEVREHDQKEHEGEGSSDDEKSFRRNRGSCQFLRMSLVRYGRDPARRIGRPAD